MDGGRSIGRVRLSPTRSRVAGRLPAGALVAAALVMSGCAGRFGGGSGPSAPPATPEPARAPAGPAPVAPADPAAPPDAPGAVSPPEHARPPTPALPATPDPLVLPGLAEPPATAAMACVDRELAERGLNAHGDPPGTLYPEPPLASDAARIDRVLARFPEIRTTCGVPPLR